VANISSPKIWTTSAHNVIIRLRSISNSQLTRSPVGRCISCFNGYQGVAFHSYRCTRCITSSTPGRFDALLLPSKQKLSRIILHAGTQQQQQAAAAAAATQRNDSSSNASQQQQQQSTH